MNRSPGLRDDNPRGIAPDDVLELRDVTVRFGGIKALSNLSLDIRRGIVTALIGPNGAGKTTLFNVVSGLVRYQQGSVKLEGRDLRTYSRSALASTGVSRTYQNLALFRGLSVEDNVMMGAYAVHPGTLLGGLFRTPHGRRAERQTREWARELLSRFGLGRVGARSVDGLPYGVLKRVELARALASRPSLLMLDEPAAGLNQREADDLAGVLRACHNELFKTLVVVEHHMGFVMNLSHEVKVLNSGTLLASGSPEEITSNELVIEAYLGTA